MVTDFPGFRWGIVKTSKSFQVEIWRKPKKEPLGAFKRQGDNFGYLKLGIFFKNHSRKLLTGLAEVY